MNKILLYNLAVSFYLTTIIILLYRKNRDYEKVIDTHNKKCKNCLWKRTELKDDE